MKKNLAEMNIVFINSFYLNEKKELILSVLLMDDSEVELLFSDVLFFGMSEDSSPTENYDGFDPIEISHDFRQMQQKDFELWGFLRDEEISKHFFHIITIHGDTVLKLICKELKVTNSMSL